MRGSAAKALRRESGRVAHATVQALSPPITAALQNEHRTRQRVENLEQRASKAESVIHRGFWGRLRWLLTGS